MLNTINVFGRLKKSGASTQLKLNRIGKRIIEFEQGGKVKVEYGTKLFEKVAKDLKNSYGKGFSRTNVIYIRLLYIKFPKSQTLSDQLSWSHYVELLGVTDKLDGI